MLEIGSVIDEKYKILSVIGHGGMSTVYLAINEKANKPWAIKEVRKDGVQNFEIVRQSLMVETDMLKKLSHKGLPSIVDVIDKDDNFLIVMDYIEGNTLKSLLKEQGAQKQEDVVDWAIQLCDVLKYLHERPTPIIYRDLKPANIMLKSDGSVILIDFGTAREYKESNIGDTTCLGTQGYAAPEQFGGKGQTDARTDIYCLGTTMYHLLTGHNPSEPPYEIYPITKWNENLSTGLEQIILKCTQKNPEDRYQSAEELLHDLKHYRDLDLSAIDYYKKSVVLFISTLLIGVAFLVGGFVTSHMGKKQVTNQYDYFVDLGNKSTTKEDALTYYQYAIDVDAARSEAYQGMIDLFLDDGVFDDEEESILVQLNISVDKYLNHFSENNEVGYADFCFDVGTLYWYYYSHEENRQTNAVKWFQSAHDYYEKTKNREIEVRRSQLYIDIGTFYKRIMLAQVEGTDDGMYTEYWSDLLELKKMNDEEPDREMITLRLYKEIAGRITEYASYLLEEGISKDEMLGTLEEIEKDINSMKDNKSSAISAEIEQTRILIKSAKDMLDSSGR